MMSKLRLYGKTKEIQIDIRLDIFCMKKPLVWLFKILEIKEIFQEIPTKMKLSGISVKQKRIYYLIIYIKCLMIYVK